MEVITIGVIACLAVFVMPFLLLLCADTKKDDGEPKLRSVKSSKKNGQRKSSNSSQRKNKPDSKEEETVITNGPAVAAYEEVNLADTTSPSTTTSPHEEPEARTGSQRINEALLTNGGTTSPVISVVNEVSPGSSQRSSRASNGQQRISQDRALPEIPGPSSTRHSVNSERSPSSKRALPDLPGVSRPLSELPVSGDADEDGINHYDQLERDVPANQIKPKSESSSIKVNMRHAAASDDGLESGDDMIVPDEVTRSSVFVLSNHDPYSSVIEDESKSPATPVEHSSNASQENTKQKARVQYSKVKKDSSADKDPKSPGAQSMTFVDEGDPVYSEAPPVPVKMYDMDTEAGDIEGAAAAAQDSDDYAVTNDGPPLAPAAAHDDLPESYDILTARESIASVRARQRAPVEEEDYYESMDDKPSTEAAAPQVHEYSTELYAEIDNQPSAYSYSLPAHQLRPPVIIQHREELYAEIDAPMPASAKPGAIGNGASSNSLHPSQHSDYGYEKVEFGVKGEQTDSAGYAIVKEATGATASAVLNGEGDIDEYAVCGGPSDRASPLPPALVNERLTRNGSDLSDYATVSFNDADDARASPQPPQPPPLPHDGVNHNQERKRYPKREHLYQEIDEVRIDKTPPDKK